MSPTTEQRARALARWADQVELDDLVEVDAQDLRAIAELTDERARIESDLREAVAQARQSGWSWAMIGTMLGVSKQAAHRKYGASAPPAA